MADSDQNNVYTNLNRIIVWVEDDDNQRKCAEEELRKAGAALNLDGVLSIIPISASVPERSAIFKVQPDNCLEETGFCIVPSVPKLLEHMAKYQSASPDATLLGIFDYHLGGNIPGEKKPCESLFEETPVNMPFTHYLYQPSMVIVYTGKQDVLKNSPALEKLPERYPQ